MAKTQKSNKDQKQVSSKETREQEQPKPQEVVTELVRNAYNRSRKQYNYNRRKGRTDLAERYKGEKEQYGSILSSMEEGGLKGVKISSDSTFAEKEEELKEREKSIKEREQYLQRKYTELRERESRVGIMEAHQSRNEDEEGEGEPSGSSDDSSDDSSNQKEEQPKSQSKSQSKGQSKDQPKATDAAKSLAKEENINLSDVKPTGADGDITVDSVREHMDKNSKKK